MRLNVSKALGSPDQRGRVNSGQRPEVSANALREQLPNSWYGFRETQHLSRKPVYNKLEYAHVYLLGRPYLESGGPSKSSSLSLQSSSDSPCWLPGETDWRACSPKARFRPLGLQGQNLERWIYIPFNTRGLDLLKQQGDQPHSQFIVVELWTGGTHHSHSWLLPQYQPDSAWGGSASPVS